MLNIESLKEQEGVIIADSVKVISKILNHGRLKPLELFIREDLKEDIPFENFQKVTILQEEDLKKIKGEKYHKGAIASFEKPPWDNVQKNQGPYLILNGVTSPENVGAMVRTISGLDFKGIIFDSKSCNPLVRRAIRVSMGNFIFLDLIPCDDLPQFIRNTHLDIFATANIENSINLNDWKPSKESAFIIGSEGHGIDPELLPLCKGTIRIPIKEEVQHLNASNACAIIASRYLFNS